MASYPPHCSLVGLGLEEHPVCKAHLFCRCERLEEQLNDLTELHQNEILNLKQELASMEEKIAYQSYERARDIQVSSTRVQKINLICNCSCL